MSEVEHHAARTPGHFDITQQEKTYRGFLKLTKWTVIIHVVLLALLAIFLV